MGWHRSAIGALLLLTVAWALAGCGGSDGDKAPVVAEKSLAGVELTLLVVDDPRLAAAAEALRGEWNTQTGAEFEVKRCSAAELAEREPLGADAVIFPAPLLPVLAEDGRIAPIPVETLEQKPSRLAKIFEVLRTREAAWDATIYAVPFGSPVLTCYYRADLLEALGRRPPESWEEYAEVAELLADRAKLGEDVGDAAPAEQDPWCGTVEPLAPGWAGLTLLARAAPAAKHRDNFAALFDLQTMEPQVAGPPFVKALEQLVSASRFGPKDPAKYDPATARAAFWRGECAMALSWPTGAKGAGAKGAGAKGAALPDRLPDGWEVGFLELFGSPEVYDVATRKWESRGPERETHVTLLDVAGRLGVVSAGSQQKEAALELLFWLSDEPNDARVSAASPATTLFRETHLTAPGPWVEAPVPDAAAEQYALAVDAALRRSQFIFALRIPGRQEYLAALDEAVLAAVRGEKPPAEALDGAAEQWREITARHGVEQQKRAYWRSLGVE